MRQPPKNEVLIRLANELNLIGKKIEEIRAFKLTGNKNNLNTSKALFAPRVTNK